MKHSTLTMFRRVMAMTLALLLVVGLTGCFGKDDPAPTDEPTGTVTEAPTDTATEVPTDAPTEAPTEPPVKGVMGTVSANNLNVRSNHSTDSTVLSQLPVNLRVEILEQKTINGTNWGRIADMTLPNGTKASGGWLNLHYVKLDASVEQAGTNDSTNAGTSTDDKTTTVDPDEEKLGTITAEQLTIRKGAGTTYDSAGSYKKGDRVKILETKTVSGTTWGKTDKGWISMTYVKLDGSAGTAVDTGTNVAQPGATTPTTGSSSGTGTGTGTSTGSGITVSNGKSTILGYVVVDCDGLTLRAGPGTTYKALGAADEGDRYPYYQTSNSWYRTSHGWLSNANSAYLYIEGTTASDAGIAVIKATELNVRQGPGTNFNKLTTLKKGESLVVLGRSDGWGYTRLGWIDIDPDFVTFTKGITYTTGTAKVIASSLNIREKADASSKDLGSLAKDKVVTVLEISGSWGKIEYATGKYGWINMSYVKMTSVSTTTPTTPADPAAKYSITIPSTSNGTVSASAASIEAGKTVTLYVTPANEYKLGTLAVKNASGGAVTATAVTGSTNYTFTMPASNVTVTATFVGKNSTEHTVTINSGAGGTVVTANGASKFVSGTPVTLTVTPAAGYELDVISATNTSIADPNASTSVTLTASTDKSTQTFDMPAGNVTINATFKKIEYNMTPAGTVTGGSVVNADSSKTKYNYGDTVTLTVTASDGYEVDKVTATYNGSNTITATADTTTAGKYTFIMPPAATTVTATFKKINYTVTVAETQNGTASVDKSTATITDEVTVTVAPNSGFVASVTCKQGDTPVTCTKTSDTTYKFEMPAGNVTVTAAFEAVTP